MNPDLHRPLDRSAADFMQHVCTLTEAKEQPIGKTHLCFGGLVFRVYRHSRYRNKCFSASGIAPYVPPPETHAPAIAASRTGYLEKQHEADHLYRTGPKRKQSLLRSDCRRTRDRPGRARGTQHCGRRLLATASQGCRGGLKCVWTTPDYHSLDLRCCRPFRRSSVKG